MLARAVEYYPNHTQFGSEMTVHHACTCQPKLTGSYKLTGACSYSMFVILQCVCCILSLINTFDPN